VLKKVNIGGHTRGAKVGRWAHCILVSARARRVYDLRLQD